MYLRKVEGPRAIRLPDGTWMTRADLPPPASMLGCVVAGDAVVRAVAHGLVSRGTALETWGLSEEEFAAWEAALEAHGEVALRATALRRPRQP